MFQAVQSSSGTHFHGATEPRRLRHALDAGVQALKRDSEAAAAAAAEARSQALQLSVKQQADQRAAHEVHVGLSLADDCCQQRCAPWHSCFECACQDCSLQVTFLAAEQLVRMRGTDCLQVLGALRVLLSASSAGQIGRGGRTAGGAAAGGG